MRDVEVEVEAEKELLRRAIYDDLTGALKRDEAILRLTALSSGERRSDHSSAILFVDVDEFKTVNDSLGHSAGDAVLIAVTNRIRSCIRAGDLLARMGGDEFLVVLDGVENLTEATTIAEKVRLSAAEPVTISGQEAHATLSIGVTIMSAGEDIDAMIARADSAMYAAKRHGRNRVVPVNK
ncbi:MAG: GGDEF domain-containing protein [Actinomycetota bacterium]|nr:GGDEF domain-containing protein [Actinomycetota bacterium]